MFFKLLYPNFKSKAVTFSYDDGIIHDRKLIEIFRKYDIKATFNLNYGKTCENKYRLDKDNKEIDCSYLDLDNDYHLYDGFEIANHSFSHPHMEDKSYEEQVNEIDSNNKALTKLTHTDIKSFCYPYGTYNINTVKALKDLKVCYSRTTKSTYSFDLPTNFLLWHPTIHHRDLNIFDCIERFKNTSKELALLYIWGHSYEFAIDDNFTLMEKIITEIKTDDEVISMSNYDIYEYVNYATMLYYRSGQFINPTPIDIYVETDEKKILIPKNGVYKYEER